MNVTRATPVLFVDRVEATRDFFLKLGFSVMFDVPEGDRLGFVGLVKDGVQVMAETRGNGMEAPAMQALTKDSRGAVIFIEVDDLEAVIAALAGEKVFVDRHETFYGADEISYLEPGGGHVVTFARFAK